ncbi:MAG: S-methyl-5'-thioinosine phosphorylase [Burkholderiaceae bacterium]|nr:S-methyl-5'-thioinosine phosphorylase [Burkholderiaceae bacterium]
MLAIIGGTGLYDLAGLQITKEHTADTPFGRASGPVLQGHLHDREILFLARHGAGHRLLPHEVNYRANVFALKACGATQILGFSAVGSLAEDVAPGELAMPSQYFDWTRGARERTFFGGGVAAHISSAMPVSGNLVSWVADQAKQLQMTLHTGLTYACVEGPRLGTRAESHFMRSAGCHLVGMTNIPEAFLAREAQICYATVGIVTDYDCWMDDPAKHVSVSAIFELYGKSLAKARQLLDALLATPLPPEEPEIRGALRSALMTPESALTPQQRDWLSVLQR